MKNNLVFQTIIITFITLLFYLPFVYRGGAGEADSSYMVGAIHQVAMDSTPERQTMFYMHSGQPLYNLGYCWIIQLFGMSFNTFLSFANHMAAFSTAVSAAALFYLSRLLKIGWFGIGIGLLVYCTAPYTIELATYSHPQTISICLVMVSICFTLRFFQSDISAKTVGMFLIPAAIFGIIGLLVRMDGAILYSVILGFFILDSTLFTKKKFPYLVYPAAILGFAIAFRTLLVTQNTSATGTDLIKLLINFSDTEISTGLSRIPITFGIGGIAILFVGFLFAIVKDDYKGALAGLVILVPTTYYCCQNALVPRRFIHMFIVAGLSAAVFYRSAYCPIEINESKRVKKAKGKPSKVIPTIPSKTIPYKTITFTIVFVCFSNWFLSAVFSKMAEATGSSYPNTVIGNGMKRSIFARHFSQQKYYSWLNEAYYNAIPNLVNRPHDIIGSWGDYGELFSAFARHNIPVMVTATPAKDGKPGIKSITAGNVTHAFYSPPWDIPPGQQNPEVLLLGHYGSDVRWGLNNIKVIAPPEDVKYNIW